MIRLRNTKRNTERKMTKEEYREIFDKDFKTLCRLLKEKGVYKHVMTYLFKRDNKCKEDLFNAMLHVIKTDVNIGNGSLRRVLNHIHLMGFVKIPFTPDDLDEWEECYRDISDYLYADIAHRPGHFIADNIVVHIDD
jgi:hypothetical protein